MPVQTEQLGDDLLHRYDLSGEGLQLDLTTPSYRLQDGQCSMILGWDVLSLNKDRPDRGRRPLGVFIPVADRPLTFVEEVNFEAVILKARVGVVLHDLAYDGVITAREASPLRAAGMGTYNPVNGSLTLTGAFAGYVFREGDRISIGPRYRTHNSLQGVHLVQSKSSADVIFIPTNLTSASASASFLLFQGRGFGYRASGDWLDPALPSEAVVVMSPDEYDLRGPWDAFPKIFLRNEDGRQVASARYSIKSVFTYARRNDALLFSFSSSPLGPMFKFSVLSESRSALQGILCGNGRKFWLLSGGVYTLLLDLGDDVYVGSRWRQSRIASNRIMLTTEKFPPIVIHLDSRNLVLTAYDRDRVLSGQMTPSKPDDVEFIDTGGGHIAPSWAMRNAIGSSSMEAGRIKAFVRLVNPYDNMASDFVEVIAAGENETFPITFANKFQTVVAGDYVSIYQALRTAASTWAPFFHSRAVHLELWRTESIPSPGEGVNFYKEAVVLLTGFPAQENDLGDSAGATYAANYGTAVSLTTAASKHPVKLSNANLVALSLLTNTEFSWGRLPPICRDVVSLGGVTLCFGKASDAKISPLVYLRDYTGLNGAYGPQIKAVGDPVHGESYKFLISPLKGWTLNANWTLDLSSGGRVTHTSGSTATFETVGSIITSGAKYIVRYGISGRTVGSVTITIGGVVSSGRTTNSDFEEDVTATATGPIIFTPSSDFNGSIEYLDISGEVTQTGLFTQYVWQEGDVLEVFYGGFSSNPAVGTDKDGVPLGQYPIASKVSNDTVSLYPNFPLSLFRGAPQKIRFSILRPFRWPWPFIGSDEEVWYSRTDVFSPESFSSRLLTLSRNGDIFRRAVRAGNYAVAVMDQAVHLIFLQGTMVLKDTIGDVGIGTPWEDSVAVLDNMVLWATSQGVRVLQVSSDVDQNGSRATLSWLTDLRFESWFWEAAQNGDRVDSGVDRTNQTFRFRRFKGNNVYQVLQFSLRTKRWTLLDDDNGLRYASSRYVEAAAKVLPAMYSVDATGAALEVNLRSRHAIYSGRIVQSDLSDTAWEVRATSLRRLDKPVFSEAMVGDIVRFRSSDPAVNDTVRTVLTAGRFFITFDAVPGLSAGDSFLIGAIRFRRRYAPLQGSRREHFKTIQESLIRLRQGETNGKLTLRWYEDLSAAPRTEESFNVNGSGGAPINVLGSKDAQGSALELELESLNTDSDFEIESVEAAVREEKVSVV